MSDMKMVEVSLTEAEYGQAVELAQAREMSIKSRNLAGHLLFVSLESL